MKEPSGIYKGASSGSAATLVKFGESCDGKPSTGLWKMGPAGDPDVVLHTLEKVDIGASWDRTMWALQQPPCLTREVQFAYMALSRDFAVVKGATLNQVGVSTEKYCQKLRPTRWTRGLQPCAFAQKLTDCATHWLRPDTQTGAGGRRDYGL